MASHQDNLASERCGKVASTKPAKARMKAYTCTVVKLSPNTNTPTAAVPNGISTINTAACEAGTERTPVIHSQTVQTLAAKE